MMFSHLGLIAGQSTLEGNLTLANDNFKVHEENMMKQSAQENVQESCL
jgi:hypothetical protein